MKIYIDNECKCHAAAVDGLREFDVSFFDGKCDTFIEGYRFIPDGESWTRPDGEAFVGEMISPWKDYAELDAAQRAYERQLMEDMKAALNELGVYVNG